MTLAMRESLLLFLNQSLQKPGLLPLTKIIQCTDREKKNKKWISNLLIFSSPGKNSKSHLQNEIAANKICRETYPAICSRVNIPHLSKQAVFEREQEKQLSGLCLFYMKFCKEVFILKKDSSHPESVRVEPDNPCIFLYPPGIICKEEPELSSTKIHSTILTYHVPQVDCASQLFTRFKKLNTSRKNRI